MFSAAEVLTGWSLTPGWNLRSGEEKCKQWWSRSDWTLGDSISIYIWIPVIDTRLPVEYNSHSTPWKEFGSEFSFVLNPESDHFVINDSTRLVFCLYFTVYMYIFICIYTYMFICLFIHIYIDKILMYVYIHIYI